MNILHLHLLLNHVPVVGAVIGVVMLAVAVARRRNELGKVAFVLFAAIAGIAVVVFLTGEPAEHLAEKLPSFPDEITERHEEAALMATIAVGVIGASCLIALGYFRRRELPRWITSLMLAGSIGATGMMGYTANLGGQIRHTEIRTGAVLTPTDERPDRE